MHRAPPMLVANLTTFQLLVSIINQSFYTLSALFFIFFFFFDFCFQYPTWSSFGYAILTVTLNVCSWWSKVYADTFWFVNEWLMKSAIGTMLGFHS